MSELFLIHATLATPRSGGAMPRVEITPDATVHMVDGLIKAICAGGHPIPGARVLDCRHCLVTPGLIDAHTHLVFGGWRQAEIAKRLAGADYMQILREGGGILDTVRHTRAASEAELLEKGEKLMREMLAQGVTACEIKSGYGLDLDTELKQLRVARALGDALPMDVRTTFLGAHAVPKEWGSAGAYADLVADVVLPAVAERGLADYCDVFCEDGVFDVPQSRMILEAARSLGLGLKIHAEELGPSGGAALAAALQATSADHLIQATDPPLMALAASGAVAVLLPQTSLYLDKPYARARRMIELGLPVALATDFNPGSCPSNNLQLSMTLGLVKYKMTPEEVLGAVTLNAARAIGLEDRIGSVEPGKQADLVVWDADDLAMLCYRMGANLVQTVFKRGEIVWGDELK